MVKWKLPHRHSFLVTFPAARAATLFSLAFATDLARAAFTRAARSASLQAGGCAIVLRCSITLTLCLPISCSIEVPRNPRWRHEHLRQYLARQSVLSKRRQEDELPRTESLRNCAVFEVGNAGSECATGIRALQNTPMVPAGVQKISPSPLV